MLVNLGAGVDVLSTELGRRFVVVRQYVSLRLTGERVDLPSERSSRWRSGPSISEAPNVGIWSGLDGTGNRGADLGDGVSPYRDNVRFS